MQDNFHGRQGIRLNQRNIGETGGNIKKMMKDLAKKNVKILFVLLKSSSEAFNVNDKLLERRLLRIN